MKDYIRLLRPKHYLKNVLVLLPLFFSGRFFEGQLLIKAAKVQAPHSKRSGQHSFGACHCRCAFRRGDSDLRTDALSAKWVGVHGSVLRR